MWWEVPVLVRSPEVWEHPQAHTFLWEPPLQQKLESLFFLWNNWDTPKHVGKTQMFFITFHHISKNSFGDSQRWTNIHHHIYHEGWMVGGEETLFHWVPVYNAVA
jgi:hypothetical protein